MSDMAGNAARVAVREMGSDRIQLSERDERHRGKAATGSSERMWELSDFQSRKVKATAHLS